MNKNVKKAIFIFLDVLSITVSWILGYIFTKHTFPEVFLSTYYYYVVSVAVVVGLTYALGIYSNIWKYAGIVEAMKISIVLLSMMAIHCIIAWISPDLSIDWAIVTSVVFALIEITFRFLIRLYGFLSGKYKYKNNLESEDSSKKVLIMGGGSAGSMLINEMLSSDKINMKPVCVLDDDKNKIGQSINGVKIVGPLKDVNKYAEEFDVDEIIIAMPSVDKKYTSKVIQDCQTTGCKVMILPGIYQVAEGNVSISSIKDVSIQDLLGREQVKVNLDEIMGYIENKTVLVTGGGGSIGSELCRQIATHNPKQLIILDIYENNAYDIQQELLRKHPKLNLLVLIASVRDSKKINKVFEDYKPQIVFHAAAHKHVPLMETSPNEAVKNNVSGTYKVADAAGRNGTERFILISTDKAVNPTNIMGATKRICEMIIQAMNNKYKTEYVAVRFGNVLGSNGSVIPLFAKQIKEGGPVTVTDKNIVRYFMTIPEAVSLVLQAGAYAKGGEIFVLDMGDPVRIYDLAFNMIRLSGFEPFKDIDIKVTGLRPGEKLYEERLMDEEGLAKTANDKISIGKPLDIDEKTLFSKVEELYTEAYNETEKMKDLVHELVPTYVIDNRKK